VTTDEKALIALLVMAFLLSHSEITAMATLIFTARMDSAKASYQQASDTIGADTDWEPSNALQRQLRDSSEQDAQSISATYKADLGVQATSFVESWMTTHESLEGCEAAARAELAQWATTRAEWKSEQVAGYTCGSGANTGTNEWIDDLIDEDIDLPAGISADDVIVTVLPEESSNDICKEYAGQSFDIDEIDDIPDFPVHLGCPHRKVIQMK
jgi:hypothetical protein